MDDLMDNAVHWQSVFWALTTIALNTCLQDSGQVLGLPSKYHKAIRLSPFFCLCDMIDAGIRILSQARETDIRRAISLVAESRRQPLPQNEGVERESSFIRLFKWSLLIGALLQTIKLVGCRGILGTQAFAAIYWGAFCIQYSLNRAGKESWLVYHLLMKEEKEQKPPEKFENESEDGDEDKIEEISKERKLESYYRICFRQWWPVALASVLQSFLWVCILQAFLPGRKTIQSNLLLFFTMGLFVLAIYVIILSLYWLFIFSLLLFPAFALYIYILAAILAPLMLLYNKLAFVLRTRRPLTVPIMVVIGASIVLEVLAGLSFLYWQIFHTGYLFPWHLTYIFKHIPTPPVSWMTDSDWPYRTTGAVSTLIAFSLTSLYLFRVVHGQAYDGFLLLFRRQTHDEVWGASFLVLMNLMTALLYYVFLYEDQGTFKPVWAKFLG